MFLTFLYLSTPPVAYQIQKPDFLFFCPNIERVNTRKSSAVCYLKRKNSIQNSTIYQLNASKVVAYFIYLPPPPPPPSSPSPPSLFSLIGHEQNNVNMERGAYVCKAEESGDREQRKTTEIYLPSPKDQILMEQS